MTPILDEKLAKVCFALPANLKKNLYSGNVRFYTEAVKGLQTSDFRLQTSDFGM